MTKRKGRKRANAFYSPGQTIHTTKPGVRKGAARFTKAMQNLAAASTKAAEETRLLTEAFDKSSDLPTMTGRVRDNYPNIQNIPFRTAEGAVIRQAFMNREKK